MSSPTNVFGQRNKTGGLIMSSSNSSAILSVVHQNSLRLRLEELNKEAQDPSLLWA